MGTSLEEVTIRRPGTGTTSSMGRNTVWSTPTGTTVMRSGSTPIWAAMSVRDDCDTVRMAGSRRATRTCMPQEAEPPPGGEALPGVGGVVEGQLAVDGDRVVQRGEQRPPVLDHAEHARAEALVVVDEVEVAPARGQQPRARREYGQGSPKPAVHMTANSRASRRSVNSRGCGHPERVGVAVEVEAGHRGEAHAGVQRRARVAGEDLHRVAQRRPVPGSGGGCRHPGRHSAGCPGR